MELLAGVQIGLLVLGGDQLVGSPVFRSIHDFLLVFGSASLDVESGLLQSLLANLDVVNVDVNDGVLVVLVAEKLVLLFHFGPLEWLNGRVVEGR